MMRFPGERAMRGSIGAVLVLVFVGCAGGGEAPGNASSGISFRPFVPRSGIVGTVCEPAELSWTSLLTFEGPNGSWPFAYASIPGGFVFANKDAAGMPVLRYRDLRGRPLRPDVPFPTWSAGFIRSFNLVRTAAGLMLNIAPRSV